MTVGVNQPLTSAQLFAQAHLRTLGEMQENDTVPDESSGEKPGRTLPKVCKRQVQSGCNPTLQMAEILSPRRSEVNEKNRIPTPRTGCDEEIWG